jgi:hypothetical protein
MAESLPTPPPARRPYEIQKAPKNLRLMWSCSNPEHDKVLLFESQRDAMQHKIDTGHDIQYVQVEFDAPIKSEKRGIL